MSGPTRWLKMLVRGAHRRRFEEELDQELRFHLDMEIEALVAKGHSLEEARAIAQRSFGRVEAHKDEVRDARGLTLLDDVGRDLRFALRTMWRNRSFVAVALLCLGLGIGANAAVFSVIDAVLLRPLPYGSPERLVRLYETQPQRGGGWKGSVSVLNYEDFGHQVSTLEDVTAFEVGSKNLSGEEGADRIRVVGATSGFFRLLRVRPMLGRGFAAGEDQPGQARVAVLSESLWRRRFGASPDVLSRTVTLDGQPYQVIGVISDLFTFPGREHADAFLPLEVSEERRKNRGT